MNKRPRPYIPLCVRVEVAERDVPKGLWWQLYLSCVEAGKFSLGKRMMILLGHLGDVQLDHDPALILRPFDEKNGKYTPDANDPAHLVYRERAAHQQKTTGRAPGAERTVTTKGSDIWLKTKFSRLEGKKRPKAKIPSRPWPTKQRKFQ